MCLLLHMQACMHVAHDPGRPGVSARVRVACRVPWPDSHVPGVAVLLQLFKRKSHLEGPAATQGRGVGRCSDGW